MAPSVSHMSCSWGSLQQGVNVIGLIHPEQTNRAAVAAVPKPGAVPFSRAESPNRTWLLQYCVPHIHRSACVPFSAPSAFQ